VDCHAMLAGDPALELGEVGVIDVVVAVEVRGNVAVGVGGEVAARGQSLRVVRNGGAGGAGGKRSDVVGVNVPVAIEVGRHRRKVFVGPHVDQRCRAGAGVGGVRIVEETRHARQVERRRLAAVV